jgi:HD-GYP domain-containing protein (c-di-GMP phosphodiesterase class II)
MALVLTPPVRELLALWLVRLEEHLPGSIRHACCVAAASQATARRLGLSPPGVEAVTLSALLHDIGKLGVPGTVLNKRGPLDECERMMLRQHAICGRDLLGVVPALRPLQVGAWMHHERWDGSGYPSGLRGRQISLTARIIALADVWCALCEARPYRAAWSQAAAWQYVRQQAGSLFDPQVVQAFCPSGEEGRSCCLN